MIFKRNFLFVFISVAIIVVAVFNPLYSAVFNNEKDFYNSQQDTVSAKNPTLEKLPSIKDIRSPLKSVDLPKVDLDIVYDIKKGEYVVRRKVGKRNIGAPSYMSVDEYKSYDFEQSIYKYWKERSDLQRQSKDNDRLIGGKLKLGGAALESVLGDNPIEIIPQGSAELSLGVDFKRQDRPDLMENQKKSVNFKYDSKIQANVTGKVGDKFKVNFDYNTQATFDFENNVKIEYKGDEDEIIQRIEAGNVSFPLSGTLITGSQSLFGVRADLQFGKLSVSSVFSQQKGESSVIEVKGGATTQSFQLKADAYEANKHFFITQYFRENYNKFVSTLPNINSGIQITRVEVWVTNKTSKFDEARNIVALMDLGESQNNISNAFITETASGNPFKTPDNGLNNLYSDITALTSIRQIENVNSGLQGFKNFQVGKDYEKIESARLLSEREYTVNRNLGYISLNSALNNDEVLGIAYEYQSGGKIYRVGEFSNDVKAPDVLLLKLIKGTNVSPKLNTWRLMMKNVYATGGYQINSDGFFLDLLYQDDKTGSKVNYIPAGNLNKKILMQILGFDKLNMQGYPTPDAIFDYVEGVTVMSSNGRIFLPSLEPFGQDVYDKFDDPNLAKKYAFTELYDSTITKAKEQTGKNKFLIVGSFKSSAGSDIQLNAMNVPKGSVKVSAGGIQLIENIDYTVDYTLGRVKIINPAYLESGSPLKISMENNSLFNIQTKTLMGSHLNYQVNDDFNIGGTIISLSERPLTQKVDFGNQPIHNVLWGLNTSYKTDSRFLTKLVDKIPFIETKEMSNLNLVGEFAQFNPGTSNAVGSSGTTYLDDFEGAETSIGMENRFEWYLSSIPQLQPSLFPEASENDLKTGYNRALLSWYNIDPVFQRDESLTPSHIRSDDDQQSNHFVREVYEQELFPAKESQNYEINRVSTFNIAYYPEDRGPYNFDTSPSPVSAGLNSNGKLVNPITRWAGIMRDITISNFEQSNVEYIEFWLMDPFVYDPTHKGGDMYINLGNISEDILKDSRKSFEYGLPKSDLVVDVDTTVWGRVPSKQFIGPGFATEALDLQDIGFDGLNDTDEKTFFKDYVNYVSVNIGNKAVKDSLISDPSGDDFRSCRGAEQDELLMSILDRYKYFANPQGNSSSGAVTKFTTMPNEEDINNDNTLSEVEAYYQYKIKIRPEDLNLNNKFITDIAENSTHKLPNGKTEKVKWYQFKIPVSEFDGKYGPIDDFTSIRFMRLFLKGFDKKIFMRFAYFKLVRSEWRKIDRSFAEGHEGLSTPETSGTGFVISTVSIEKNGNRASIPYVLPPGIEREKDYTTNQTIRQNEQSLSIKVDDLKDGDAKAIYKNTSFDLRSYQKLLLEVHAEALQNQILNDNDLSLFIRLGSDFKDNYYEYQIPLKVTDEGANVPEKIWPIENQLNVALSKFADIKLARNRALKIDPNVTYTTRYSLKDGDNFVSIAGNPTLADIRTLVIGVRNPAQNINTVTSDDGLPKSAEIWVNEFRVANPDESGGWAATGRLTTKLADFATISLAGSITMPGFGSIEKKVHELSKDKTYSYDVATNFRLGKFFPDNLKVSMPMFIGFSQGFVNPKYDPVNTDILLEESLKNYSTKAEKDSIRFLAQDFTERRSLNFSNIQVNKTSKKPMFYDPANFSFNYSFNSQFHRDINTLFNYSKNYRGGFSYIYNMRNKPVYPFRKIKPLKSKYTRLISDFNIGFLPSQFSFRTDLTRQYNEVKFRNISQPDLNMPISVNKDFLWNRNYSLKWDLAQSLSFDYKANVKSRIAEPDTLFGYVNRDVYAAEYNHWKKVVWNSILDGGDPVQYYHSLDLNYRLPINKIPGLDWVSANVSANTSYSWDFIPVTSDTLNFGNKIQNSSVLQANGQLNIVKLYNYVGFLKKINTDFDRIGTAKKNKKKISVDYTQEKINFNGTSRKSIKHNLKTTNITVDVFAENGSKIDSIDFSVVDKNTVRVRLFEVSKNCKVVVKGKVDEKQNVISLLAKGMVRILMGVREIRASYSVNEGTFVPGYNRSSSWFGMSGDAPGVPFILGWQDKGFGHTAVNSGWITSDPYFNSYYTMNHNQSLMLRSRIEPLNGFRIDLTASRNYSKNSKELFNGSGQVGGAFFDGNFSISTVSFATAFEHPSGDNNYHSDAYELFKSYRKIISNRQANNFIAQGKTFENDAINPNNIDAEGYREGFSSSSQEVVLPAFFAAYTGQNPNKVGLGLFKNIPLPNWKLTADVLKTFYPLKKNLRTFNITHSYSSVYSIGNFSQNSVYYEDEFGVVRVDLDKLDAQRNMPSETLVSGVSLNEKFAPFIGFDLSTTNNLTARFAYNKARNITFGLANNQMIEDYNKEYVIGLGYRFDDLSFIFKSSSNSKLMKSVLNLKADFSIKDNINIIRKLAEDVKDITGGRRSFSLRATADMVISSQLNLIFYFERKSENPYVSNSYDTSNTQVGFTLRFNLSQ